MVTFSLNLYLKRGIHGGLSPFVCFGEKETRLCCTKRAGNGTKIDVFSRFCIVRISKYDAACLILGLVPG